MTEIVDLRGREVALPASPVLADPSGRRARILARGGRLVAVLFCLWFVGLALAGMGILPSGYVPLGAQINAPPTPPKTNQVHVLQPTRSDLAAAQPAAAALSASAAAAHVARIVAGLNATASVSTHGGAPGASRHASGSVGGLARGGGGTHGAAGAGAAGSHGGTTGSASGASGGTSHGKGTAPGQARNTATPGHTKTTTPGNSGSAPGRQTTTPTTTPTTPAPGHSGSAPGQTGLQGSGGARSY
jgi:hypothetical protein